MPTPEEIKELAQSYVDELFAHDDMQEQETIEAKNDALVMCMAFVGHILETHCIVEKGKLDELHKESSQNYRIANNIDKQAAYYARGKIDALTTLFGTAIFNEEKK